MKRIFSAAVSLLLILCVGGFAIAQSEHPKTSEHPKKEEAKKEEHPKAEHPAKKMTTADIDTAITAHITDKSKADNAFHAEDKVLDKTWNLSLVKVHKDKLTALDADNYFACVDFKADDGTAVDVDFFLKNEGGKLVVTDTSVHKINGQARYMYEEKDGYWHRVDTKAETSKKEHPKKEEHPTTETAKKEHPEEKEHPEKKD